MYLGRTPDGDRTEIPASDLLTHGVVLGRTGSGKSGLTIALIEEAAKSGASILALDPKGDLTNLALSLVSKDEWNEWADEDTRLRHGDGLASADLGFEDVKRWRDAVDVNIYSPGKTGPGGRSVNMFPDFEVPANWPFKGMGYKANREVRSVLSTVAGISDAGDPAVVFLTEAIMRAWARGQALPMEQWPGVLTNPPESLTGFGGMKLNEFYPKKKRTDLARTLIGFQHQADRWIDGDKLNLHDLVRKPTVAVFSMRHLMEEDRQFFAGLLLSKVVEFMFETEASERLKLLVVLDEARGYLPPYPHNPPTKDPICTILAQGRAQGIGMIVGTQNPMDLDYKALSNVGTWFLGRLRERDCNRDLATELGARGIEPEDVADVPQRSFLMLDKRGEHRRFETRWCLNYLFGPMSGKQLQKLSPTWQENLVQAVLKHERETKIKVHRPEPGEKPPVVVLPRPAPVHLEEVMLPVQPREARNLVEVKGPENETGTVILWVLWKLFVGALALFGLFVLGLIGLVLYLNNM